MLWDLSVNNMSLQFDHTHCLDTSEMEACLHLRVSNHHRRRQQWESFFLSPLHPTIQFDFVHQLHDLRQRQHTNFCKQHVRNHHVLVSLDSWDYGIQSDSENFCFQGFFIFIVPISTSSRSASISSMSSPSRARSVVRGFVGLTSALLCHTRFPAAENCSQYWVLLVSLLCSSRN